MDASAGCDKGLDVPQDSAGVEDCLHPSSELLLHHKIAPRYASDSPKLYKGRYIFHSLSTTATGARIFKSAHPLTWPR